MVSLVTTTSGEEIVLPLCQRCSEGAFSSESWEKLFGVHPGTRGPKNSDAVFDGEFQYSTVHLGAQDLPPRRGPILRLRVPAKDLMRSSGLCGFCKIVVKLDTKGKMVRGRYKDPSVDLQLFIPLKCSGTWLPFVMQVTLTLESAKPKKQREWRNTRLLAFLSQPEDADKAQKPSGEEAAISDPMHSLLEEAKEWMQECEDCHTDCALPHEPLLPMRILDVQALESVGKVKLVESADRQHGRYVALSYVWGKKPFLRLQSENRDLLMDSIHLQDLPKTIRDAVQVTRAFDIRYLWVDSLCILQDSDTDKTMQIPDMNAYYRQATAVISASNAVDVHSGFLGSQSTEEEIYASAESSLVADHPEFGPLLYRVPVYYPGDDHQSSEVCHVHLKPPLYNYKTEPVNKRGWTLQETSLARRLLVFPEAGGIVMRCSKGECYAGHLLGNPFHEEAGTLYHEMEISEENSDQEDDEDCVDEDSGGNSGGERSKDYEKADRQPRLRREIESDSEKQENEYDGSDESLGGSSDKDIDEGGYEGNDGGKYEGSHEGSPEASAWSNDGFDVKCNDTPNEHQNHQEEDRRWVFWTPRRESYHESANDQEENWNESSSEDHASMNSSHDKTYADERDDGKEDEYDNEYDNRHDSNSSNREHENEDKISQSWYAMVQDYSQRALSQPDDILIALGALAQEFHTQNEDILGSYIAGLWTRTLRQGLLWHVSYARHPDRESFIPPQEGATEYHAPSWSWASSKQPVTFRTQREPNIIPNKHTPDEPTWHIEIVDCGVTLKDKRNPFGAVRAAYLDVEGLLAPIQRVPGKRWHSPDRCPVDDVALTGNTPYSHIDQTDLFAPDSIEALEQIDPSCCYWLPVYDATRARSRGLFVRKIASGQYRRLGFAEFQVEALNVFGEKSVIRLI